MPALGSPSTWRTHPQRFRGYLYVAEPSVVARATVASSITYPVASMTISFTAGSAADVKTGMTVLFGSSPGESDLGRQRVRSISGTTLGIGQSSQGERRGEINATSGTHVTFLNLFEPWSKIPRFDGSTDFKDFDIAIGTYGTNRPPVANAGAPALMIVSGSSGSVSFDASESIDPVGGGLSYSWDFADGTPSSSSSSTATVSFPTGFRYVRLTITDTASHEAYHDVPVAIINESDAIDCETLSRQLTRDGGSFSARIFDNLDENTYPDGSLVLYAENEWYADTQTELAGPTGREQVRFFGWINSAQSTIEGTREGLRTYTEIVANDIGDWLSRLPGFAQLIEHDATPSNWREMDTPTLEDFLLYLIIWHSTAAELTNLTIASGISAWVFPSLEANESTIFSQVNELSRVIPCMFTCDARGLLRIVYDPILQETGDRTSTVIVYIDEQDYTEISFNRRYSPPVYWMRGEMVKSVTRLTDIAAFFSNAPGAVPGQGGVKSSMKKQLVTSQAQCNQRLGQRYARENREYESVSVQLAHGNDAGIDPALGEWVTITLSDDARRGITFSTTRALVTSVSIDYDVEAKRKAVSLELEIETSGTAGETYYYPRDGEIASPQYAIPTFPSMGAWLPEFPGWIPDIGSFELGDIPYANLPLNPNAPTSTTTPQVSRAGNAMILCTEDAVVITEQFLTLEPRWTVVTPDIDTDEDIVQVLFDEPQSGRGAYVLVSNATDETSRVYHTDDVFSNNPTWSTGGIVYGEFTIMRTTGIPGQLLIYSPTGTGPIPPVTLGELTTGVCVSPGKSVTSSGGDFFLFDSGTEPKPPGCFAPAFEASAWFTSPAGFSIDSISVEIGTIREAGFGDPGGLNLFDPLALPAVLDVGGRQAIQIDEADSQIKATLEITGIPTTEAIVSFSQNYGETWDASREVGAITVGGSGFDVPRTGAITLAAADTGVEQSTQLTASYFLLGTYSNLYSGFSGTITAIHLPWFAWGSTTEKNYPTPTNVDVLVATTSKLYRINDGSTLEDVTPGSSVGIGPNHLTSVYGTKAAAVLDDGGTRKLYVSTDGAANFVYARDVSSDCEFIRSLRGDLSGNILFVANGTDMLFSDDWGTSFATINVPTGGKKILSFDPYG